MTHRIELTGPGAGQVVVPLNPMEQADYEARVAAAPGVEAATQAQIANGETLRARARQALQANATFLGLPPAQQGAQAVAQTVRLTQQVTALIRLAIGALDSTAGS